MVALMRHLRIALPVAVALAAGPAHAGPDIDPTFGVGGVATQLVADAVSDQAPAVALQPDGKIVVATRDGDDFAFFRFETNGTLDLGFGTSGKTLVDVTGEGQPFDVAVQADGKIVAVGSSSGSPQHLALVRVDASGTIDTSFGTNGVVRDEFGDETHPLAMDLQTDGKIVVVGRMGQFFADAFVARYEATGAIDLSFGTGGLVLSSVGLFADVLHAVTIQPDGKILATGLIFYGGDYGAWLLRRFLPDGTPDPTFGTAGVVETFVADGTPPLTLISEALAVLVQPDGKIVAAGSTGASYLSWPSEFASARHDPSGNLDLTYGTGGITKTTPLAGTFAIAYPTAVLRRPSGALVMVGHGSVQEAYPFRSAVVVQNRADGSVDTSFSADGMVEIAAAGSWTVAGLAVDAALEAGGGVIVATRTGGNISLRRVLGFSECGNGVLDPGEGCDDGNLLDGDCCSSTCQYDTPGTPCGAGGTACLSEQCDGAGTCAATFAPATGCKAAASGVLTIKDAGGAKDKIVWTWKKGAETVLHEISAQPYTLCVYEGATATLTTAIDVPGFPCDGDHCLKTTFKKTVYTSSTGAHDGVKKLILVAGDDGKAQVKLKAKGANTPTPLLPLLPPIVAQLHGASGTCFEGTYSSPLRNDAVLFRAKQDESPARARSSQSPRRPATPLPRQ